jgi:hypothetical protein
MKIKKKVMRITCVLHNWKKENIHFFLERKFLLFRTNEKKLEVIKSFNYFSSYSYSMIRLYSFCAR